ncbi:hypothetical protein [Deinococcus yavapaiensis]|uniref:Uncharacterized protein n=1 Tax=Deinococcus yavapaiensis KR-236 TaxID=694435 RepID=A0A318SHZ2_9DEIO|nr:hypothetical protein [Deinococcus yavapaiensis]PYE50992.1 hypothetical protein DES52_11659 [Deinococcus yavapaiensis KR-236]
MPRKKTATDPTPQLLPPGNFDLMDIAESMAQDMAMDSKEAIGAAIDFEKSLLHPAHTIASQAIRVDEPDTEAERVGAAQRQVKLLSQLFLELQHLTEPQGR